LERREPSTSDNARIRNPQVHLIISFVKNSSFFDTFNRTKQLLLIGSITEIPRAEGSAPGRYATIILHGEPTMNDNKLSAAVSANIFSNVSAQVQREQESQTFVADEIAEAIAGCAEDDGDNIEVFQWWAVSERFASFARQAKEVVVDTPFGTVWGRQTCGQGIAQDLNVQAIFKAMGEI
jgi:hypothetical protein